MTRLFIENREIELDETVQFAITKQFEDLSNPTTIINDWSKTVSIPFTANNNRIFGHIYSPDKMTVATSDSADHVGIYFDPYRKLNMRLMWGDAILMTGYAKMNEVKQVSGKGTYELTLFGQLGKVFQEMSKITFDKSYQDTDYIIDGEIYVDEVIDKNLVYNSWTSSGQSFLPLYPKVMELPGGSTMPHPAYRLTDIIGFAPNNAFNEGFDYKTFQSSSEESNTFETVLGDSFKEATGVEASTVIPNGLRPREIGEYRSYLQLPFVYWNKLFQMFQKKAEAVTGYQFELDESWFAKENPYYFNLVYMLKPFDTKISDAYNNSYNQKQEYVIRNWHAGRYADSEQLAAIISHTGTTTLQTNEEKEIISYIAANGNTRIRFSLNMEFHTYMQNKPLLTTNAMVHRLEVIDTKNGHIYATKDYLMRRTGCSLTYPGATIIEKEFTVGKGGAATPFTVSYDISFTNPYDTDRPVKFVITDFWLTDKFPVDLMQSGKQFGRVLESKVDSATDLHVTSVNKISRSGSRFIFNNLWDNSVSIFKEIIRYCKTYRILIFLDDINKKIKFLRQTTLFSGGGVLDWTDKVDKTKDFKVTPITFSDKYILFNYEKANVKENKTYSEKTGLNYGEYRLVTDYNFNDSTKKLFDGNKTPIVSSDHFLSWTNLYDNHNVVYSFPNEIYVSNKDENNKAVDLFGTMFFHCGLRNFSTEAELHMRNVLITDDTELQEASNTFFYSQSVGSGRSITTYPYLDAMYGKNLCLYKVPTEVYTYLPLYTTKRGIYESLWETYINERYNTQNKLVTCYLNLTPTDFTNFSFGNFVKINNQLFAVNKIYDYSVDSNEPTKVDLITIQDTSAYSNTNWHLNFIHTSTGTIAVPYDHYKAITVSASGPWGLAYNDWQDTLTVYPDSGGSGDTTVYIGSISQDYASDLTFELYDEEDYSTLQTAEVSVNVAGTSTIDITPWYNAVMQGSSTTITLTSSSSWRVVARDENKDAPALIHLSRTSGTAGTYTITVTVDEESPATITDFYIFNDAGDGQTFRVNVLEDNT